MSPSSTSTPRSTPSHSHSYIPPRMPVKQKMALSLKSLVGSVFGGGHGVQQQTPATELFAKTDPAVDGDDCLHDCDSCTVRYPRKFSVDTDDALYGHVKGWSTHILVGTGKTDWVRSVEDEKGSVMEAVGRAKAPANGVSLFICSVLGFWVGSGVEREREKRRENRETS
ncbi:hypothetical protein G7046_g5214 [Stylonectria norvegica]|nr:hypothetical protein G7046_g5214 [Stylonectria norvegica]